MLQPGTHMGPFRLLDRLGAGGMGEVWLAEQTEPIRRRVALKIIKAGMDTQSVVARFSAERQALALMDHPYIAKVFDAGETAQGQPYFAMEYVDGLPLTEYCDRNRLDVRARLDLFGRICEAVQHAHQKTVVHRDLKPGNVLVQSVDGQALPKIIDFGIAKATEQRLAPKTLVTQIGQVVGTPAYMSPEQLRFAGEDVDTRADEYSLGVLFYELLAGVLPFDPGDAAAGGFDGLRRAILEQDAPLPSVAVAALGERAPAVAAARRTDPRRLAAAMRGDLDWIAAKAMEKERARRYQTVQDLHADVERHLRDEPVVAGPPGAGYRLQKLVRRHRVAIATLGSVLAVLVLGVVASTWGLVRALRAERVAAQQASIAEAVNKFLNEDLLAAIRPVGGGRGRDTLMRDVIDAAAARIDAASKPGGNFAAQPAVEAAIRETLGSTYVSMGEYGPAEPHLRRALTLREAAAADPKLGKARNDFGLLRFYQGHYAEAESLYLLAAEAQERLAPADTLGALAAQFNLATLYQRRGRLTEAEPLMSRLLVRYRRLFGAEHDRVLLTMSNLANIQLEMNRLAAAESLQLQVLQIRLRTVGEEHSGTMSSMNNLAHIYSSQGRMTEAESLFVRALLLKRRKLGLESASTLNTLNGLASLAETRGDYARAERLHRETLEIRERVLGRDNPITLTSVNGLAFSLLRQGNTAEANRLAQRSQAAARAQLGEAHPTTAAANLVAGLCAIRSGHFREAETDLRHVLESKEAKPLTLAQARARLGIAVANQDRRPEADSLFRAALEELPDWDAETRQILGDVVPLYQAWARTEPASGFGARAEALRARTSVARR